LFETFVILRRDEKDNVINAFKGRDPVRTKIVIDNKVIEEVLLFNHLGNIISYKGELQIDNKLSDI